MRKLQHTLWFLIPACTSALLAAAGCSLDERTSVPGDSTVLTAEMCSPMTKAEGTDFAEGTKYLLFAAKTDSDGVPDWSSPLLYADEGTERNDHTIDYGTPLTYGDSPLNFYGITYGNTTVPGSAEGPAVGISQQPKTPSITISSEAPLPDLMYSNNLTTCTVTDGYRLQMDYRHAFSKIKFMIVKQDESDKYEADMKLEDVTLQKIEIRETHKSGILDIVNGLWSYPDDENTTTRTYFNSSEPSSSEGLEIGTTAVSVSPTGTGISDGLLIFPNQDSQNAQNPRELLIAVTLSGLEESPKTVSFPLRNVDETGNDTGPFIFESNHEYTLLITVLDDDVRTIAIAPQVYEDIIVPLDPPLGQPVTFANLMWMDRNLGATSADCENDWENTRGYYYQYGRNIPYILDTAAYNNASSKKPVWQFIYTYNQYGEKVYGKYNAKQPVETEDGETIYVCGRENIAVNPGDSGFYRFILDLGSGTWMYDDVSNAAEDIFVNTFWTSSAENHPCPKGWRLPTKEDFASFMPDITLDAPWDTRFHEPQRYKGAVLKMQEELVYGKIENEQGVEESAIYILKNQGTTECYRIKIVMKESNIKGKYYFEFAYYPGTPEMTFMELKTHDEFVASMTDGRFDWTTPSSIMQVPAVGFLHPHGGDILDGDGENAILRTSEHSGSGTNWVCYLRNSWKFGLIDDSRKALGDQIRCVRDVNVQE